jgi:hypothetical protein
MPRFTSGYAALVAVVLGLASCTSGEPEATPPSTAPTTTDPTVAPSHTAPAGTSLSGPSMPHFELADLPPGYEHHSTTDVPGEYLVVYRLPAADDPVEEREREGRRISLLVGPAHGPLESASGYEVESEPTVRGGKRAVVVAVGDGPSSRRGIVWDEAPGVRITLYAYADAAELLRYAEAVRAAP